MVDGRTSELRAPRNSQKTVTTVALVLIMLLTIKSTVGTNFAAFRLLQRDKDVQDFLLCDLLRGFQILFF